MKIDIFLNVKPLEIVHIPNKETISQEILLKLGKKSDRHWYLNLDSCPCCPLPAQQHGNSTPHQQSQEHRPPSLSSYQSEDYLPGREERQHFSSDSQPPVAEAKFWGSITERWGIPSSVQPQWWLRGSTVSMAQPRILLGSRVPLPQLMK